MPALGCLLPALLFIFGALLGAVIGGERGSIWGAFAGLALGTVIPAIMLYALAAARKKR